MNEDRIRVLASAAAKWWRRQLERPSVHDNGELQQMALATQISASMPPAPKEKLDVFEESLAQELMSPLMISNSAWEKLPHNPAPRFTVMVDYHADPILWGCFVEKAQFPAHEELLRFPSKVIMDINLDGNGYVEVRSGFRSAPVRLDDNGDPIIEVRKPCLRKDPVENLPFGWGRSRIKMEDTVTGAIEKLANGVEEAKLVLNRLFVWSLVADKAAGALAGLNCLLFLDTLCVYEEKIVVLYDLCARDEERMHGLLRAWQLGEVSKEMIASAINAADPKMLGVPQVIERAKSRLDWTKPRELGKKNAKADEEKTK
jgi:hypothetical protein